MIDFGRADVTPVILMHLCGSGGCFSSVAQLM